MARYRRRPPSLADDLAAAAVSLVVGVGAALGSYYVVRLLRSREEMSQAPLTHSGSVGSLPPSTSSKVRAGRGPVRRGQADDDVAGDETAG